MNDNTKVDEGPRMCAAYTRDAWAARRLRACVLSIRIASRAPYV